MKRALLALLIGWVPLLLPVVWAFPIADEARGEVFSEPPGDLAFDDVVIPEENFAAVKGPGRSARTWGWVLFSIGVSAGLVAGISFVAIRRFGDRTRFPLTIADLPGSARVMFTLVLLIFGLVHLFGMTTAYIMSQIVNASAGEYFFYLKIGKLSWMTHAHLFGTMVMHLVVAAIFLLTNVRESRKVVLITATMLGSPIDIASWWLIKYVSPLFEALALAGEITSEAGFLTMTLISLYQLWRPERFPFSPKEA